MSDKEKLNLYSIDGTPIKMSEQPDKADGVHPAHTAWMEISELTRSLFLGTRGMIDAGEIFLPQFELESQRRYLTRLQNSVLKNAFKKTVTFLSGQVFQSEIGYSDDFPEDMEDAVEDIDLLGSTLEVFSKRIFETGIGNGVSHIYIEAPDGVTADTKAQEKADGRSPYFKEIRAENVIGWQTNELGQLTQVRFVEIQTVNEGSFGTKFEAQIRVLYAGGWEIYRMGSKEYELAEEGYTSLDYIPFVSFIPGEPLSILTAESPLQDLADLNLGHWRSSSDQTNILHVARVPILFAKGVDLEKYAVGASKAISTEDTEGADMKYVEITGASIAAGAADMKELENAMAIYGLQQMIPRTGNQTATEKSLSAAESNSNLATWVVGYEDALTKALQIYGDYKGIEIPDDAVRMPLDFESYMADPAMVQAMNKLADSKIISKQSAFNYVNNAGALGDDYTWDRIQEEIDEEQTNEGPANLGGLFGDLGAPAAPQGPAAPPAGTNLPPDPNANQQ